jgi:hypothetical protein
MGFGFNVNEYERTVGGGGANPLPVGLYGLVVTRSVMKATKDNAGKYLEVEFDVVEPSEYGNRKFWDKFNIFNKNDTAQRIGREQLSDLLKALGLDGSAEPDDLVGASVNAYLLIEPASNGYPAKNKCVKYLASGTSEEDYQAWFARAKGVAKSATAAAPVEKKQWGAAPTATTAEPAKAVPSWKKK